MPSATLPGALNPFCKEGLRIPKTLTKLRCQKIPTKAAQLKRENNRSLLNKKAFPKIATLHKYNGEALIKSFFGESRELFSQKKILTFSR